MGTEAARRRRWRSGRTGVLPVLLGLTLALTACDQRDSPWERSGVLLAVEHPLPPSGEQLRLLPPGMVPGGSPLGSLCAIDRYAFCCRYGYDLPELEASSAVPDPAAAADATLQADIDTLARMLQALGGPAQELLPRVVAPRAPDATTAGHAHLHPRVVDDAALLRPLAAMHSALRSLMLASPVVADDGGVVAAADGDAAWARRREHGWAAVDLAIRQLREACPACASLAEIVLLQHAIDARQPALVEAGIALSAQRLRQCCDQAAATPSAVDAYVQALTLLVAVRDAAQRRRAQLMAPQAVPTVVYAAPVVGP